MMQNRGIGFLLIATLSFAIMNVMVKALSDLHFMQVVFFRAGGTFILLFPYMVAKKIPLIGENPKLLFLRASAGLVSLATFFYAIQILPLGSAISIRYVGPIFGAILAFYFLKEKVVATQWLSFIVAFSGVLIIKGFDLRISYFGLTLALVSAFFLGFVFVLIRYLATREHFMTIIIYFMTLSVLVSLFFIPYWRMPVGNEWLFVVLIGIFGLIGQLFMTKAFSYAEATVLAPFKYMEIIYALIMGFIFFGESYSMISLLGMVLIVSGMIWNVLAKTRSKKKQLVATLETR